MAGSDLPIVASLPAAPVARDIIPSLRTSLPDQRLDLQMLSPAVPTAELSAQTSPDTSKKRGRPKGSTKAATNSAKKQKTSKKTETVLEALREHRTTEQAVVGRQWQVDEHKELHKAVFESGANLAGSVERNSLYQKVAQRVSLLAERSYGYIRTAEQCQSKISSDLHYLGQLFRETGGTGDTGRARIVELWPVFGESTLKLYDQEKNRFQFSDSSQAAQSVETAKKKRDAMVQLVVQRNVKRRNDDEKFNELTASLQDTATRVSALMDKVSTAVDNLAVQRSQSQAPSFDMHTMMSFASFFARGMNGQANFNATSRHPQSAEAVNDSLDVD